MTPEEAVPVLAQWIRELRYQLDTAEARATALEGRVQRLEHAARQRAAARRYWIRAGKQHV